MNRPVAIPICNLLYRTNADPDGKPRKIDKAVIRLKLILDEASEEVKGDKDIDECTVEKVTKVKQNVIKRAVKKDVVENILDNVIPQEADAISFEVKDDELNDVKDVLNEVKMPSSAVLNPALNSVVSKFKNKVDL